MRWNSHWPAVDGSPSFSIRLPHRIRERGARWQLRTTKNTNSYILDEINADLHYREREKKEKGSTWGKPRNVIVDEFNPCSRLKVKLWWNLGPWRVGLRRNLNGVVDDWSHFHLFEHQRLRPHYILSIVFGVPIISTWCWIIETRQLVRHVGFLLLQDVPFCLVDTSI